MKQLYLLRHAKSSWDDPALADHDRPLAPRGRKAGSKLARHLEREGIRPALVLCSSARRTRETLAGVAPALHGATVEVEDRLYGAGEHELLDRLRLVGDDVPSVMLIGHNPGMELLCLALTGDVPLPGEKFPTGALATLSVSCKRWRDIGAGGADLVSFVVPRELD